MMKHIYMKVVLGCLLGGLSIQAYSQLANPPIYIETVVHYGDYGDPGNDLTGYVTYYVYLQFTSTNNYLTSIFAAEAGPDCVQDADTTVHFEFPCGLFQHEIGEVFGFDQICVYDQGFAPASEFDSFITIGSACSTNNGCDILGSIGQCPEWLDNFEGPSDANYFDGGGFFWDEYAIFAAPCYQPYPDSPSNTDANNRVLIGQFTTCGNMSGCINISYQDPNGVDHVELDICFEAEHPCLTNVMDTTPDILLAGCAGEEAEVTLDGGGNGSIDYMLYDSNDVLISISDNQPAGLLITPIDVGDYYISMIDEAGCRDTTAEFTILEPTVFQLDATLETDVLCFGDLTGSISFECTGGTGTIDIIMNGVHYDCGDVATGLGCGNYVITASDENGCDQSANLQVACPPQIVFNPIVTVINCFGDDDGSIVGSVTGGTGSLTAEWTLNNAAFQSFSGPSALNVSLNALDQGTYDITIEDANGCLLEDSYEITEPEEYLAASTVTDASCFNVCDGTISYEIVGGTAPYSTVGNLVGGGVVNLNALCDGEYAVIITDDNDCIIHDTITIVEPTDIVYTLNVIDVTCFGQCDGQIQITEVAGSFEGFTYTLSPNSANCTAPCSGSEAIYTEVCSGIYDVVITDQNGCPKNIDNINVATPTAMQIVLTPTDVTCFGYDNGEILVEVIGGTEPFIITPNDSIAPATYTELAPGTYSFTVTDANGCFVSGDEIIEQPDSLIATYISSSDASCGGTCDGDLSYSVSGGTPPFDYLLLPTAHTGIVSGFIASLCADDYQLVINDLYNCADTLEFSIIEPDPLVIDVLLNAPTCTGMFDGSAEVNISGGTGALTLFINPEETDVLEIDSVTYSLSALGEGQIFFELIDENDCILLDTLDIVPDIITDMVLTTFSSPETCWNEVDGTATVAVQNGFLPISYVWDDANTQTTATAVGLPSSQEFTVIVTDNIGCTLSASVFVEPTEGCFFIATAITPNGDGVNDEWILGGLEFYPTCKINVYNRWGQNVFTSKGYSARWDATYQGEKLPVADYYFTIDYDENKDVIMGTVTIKY